MERLKQNKELAEELDRYSLTAFYPAGTRIGGKDLKALPIVLSGLLKVLQADEEGNNILLYYIQPGDTCVVSMLQGISHQPCSITAQVEEDAEIMFIPLDKAHIWMTKFPEWTDFILNSYYNRFDELLKALNSVSAEKLETRVLKYLRQRKNLAGTQILAITHQHMAADLATNRVVISRLLKSLENRGLVKLGRNKIEVVATL